LCSRLIARGRGRERGIARRGWQRPAVLAGVVHSFEMAGPVSGETKDEIELVNGAAEIVIDLRSYRLSAIKKAA